MKPKGFNFTPRYYDPDKEDLEKRIRIIEKEVAAEKSQTEISKARIKQGFRKTVQSRSNHSLIDKNRGIRLFVVLIVLIAIVRMLYRFLDL